MLTDEQIDKMFFYIDTLGNHDFSSFRGAGCQAKSPVKTLDKLEIIKNGFLHFY